MNLLCISLLARPRHAAGQRVDRHGDDRGKAHVPDATLKQCVEATSLLGLRWSGIDLKAAAYDNSDLRAKLADFVNDETVRRATTRAQLIERGLWLPLAGLFVLRGLITVSDHAAGRPLEPTIIGFYVRIILMQIAIIIGGP